MLVLVTLSKISRVGNPPLLLDLTFTTRPSIKYPTIVPLTLGIGSTLISGKESKSALAAL
ncbi:hypothetical protein [uncultured Clostridium sp.]|uniref:hypothetical protein n=1 Tax=uncultured Clostridium sp. TaxID=59620 RepID=UPI00272E27AF|nr:hypothetical protein [uncultured Clostridium sp.]